jgi:hypothetical protein
MSSLLEMTIGSARLHSTAATWSAWSSAAFAGFSFSKLTLSQVHAIEEFSLLLTKSTLGALTMRYPLKSIQNRDT